MSSWTPRTATAGPDPLLHQDSVCKQSSLCGCLQKLQLAAAQAPAYCTPGIMYAAIFLNMSLWCSNGCGLVACSLTLPSHMLQQPSLHPLAFQILQRLFLSASALSYPSPACAQHKHPDNRSHFSQQGVEASDPPLKHTLSEDKGSYNCCLACNQSALVFMSIFAQGDYLCDKDHTCRP